MAASNILTQTKYTKLLRDVRRIIEQGKARAEQAASRELVSTYWEMGKRISQENLTSNANYDVVVLKDLAEELNMDYSTLSRAIIFFQTYTIAPRGKSLSWSHYRELLPISNDAERKFYEKYAEDEKLNRDQLVQVIKEDRFRKGKAKSSSSKLKRPAEATYIYKAKVERVIDGDTLLLRVDLGFQVSKEQRIRLAGIDAPAMDEAKGKQAYQYVRDQLAKVEFVMVKTNKIDIYGRYVGDIFYSLTTDNKDKIFREGRYLNQELVSKGLARRF